MKEKLEVGSIVKGVVTGIQPYGAFIALNGTDYGLVHISEISHGYVKDIHDYLQVGDEVRVKILSKESEGKYRLSIKAAGAFPTRKPGKQLKEQPANKGLATAQGFNTLKDKLQEWIEQYQS